MAAIFCAHCGHANSGDEQYCGACGSDVISPTAWEKTMAIFPPDFATHDGEPFRNTLTDQIAAALERLPQTAAMLIITHGPAVGSQSVLDKDRTTLGRHPASDIVLDDVTVSRRHAEFRRHRDTFAVHDVGSLNGTYVNRERVTQQQLTSRDQLRVGKFHLVFVRPESVRSYG